MKKLIATAALFISTTAIGGPTGYPDIDKCVLDRLATTQHPTAIPVVEEACYLLESDNPQERSLGNCYARYVANLRLKKTVALVMPFCNALYPAQQ